MEAQMNDLMITFENNDDSDVKPPVKAPESNNVALIADIDSSLAEADAILKELNI
jgi:hypothetical protein